jgi:hypothetical protein
MTGIHQFRKTSKNMNFFINEEKTKYIPATKKSNAGYSHYIEVGLYKFQVVH